MKKQFFGLEQFNLLLPFLIVSLGLYEICFFPSLIKDYEFQFKFLVEVILLDFVHVIFTFMSVIALPNSRSWFLEKKTELLTSWTIVFTLTFILTYFSLKVPQFTPFYVLVRTLIGKHHMVRQNHGLSIAIESPASSPQVNQHWESIFYRILLVILCIDVFSALYFDYKYNQILLYSSYVLVVVYLTIGFVRYSRSVPEKVIFNSRMLLYPMGFHSMTAGLGQSAVHGIEYLTVMGRFVDNSQKLTPKDFGRISVSIAVLIFAAFFTLNLFSEGTGFLQLTGTKLATNEFSFLIPCILQAVTVTHYYADRQMFRMRDSVTRFFISPLLKKG